MGKIYNVVRGCMNKNFSCYLGFAPISECIKHFKSTYSENYKPKRKKRNLKRAFANVMKTEFVPRECKVFLDNYIIPEKYVETRSTLKMLGAFIGASSIDYFFDHGTSSAIASGMVGIGGIFDSMYDIPINHEDIPKALWPVETGYMLFNKIHTMKKYRQRIT